LISGRLAGHAAMGDAARMSTAFRTFRDFLADKALVLTVAAIAAADVGAAVGGPHWPFYALALAVLMIALVVASRRALPRLFRTSEQLGFTRNRDWLHYTIELKGTPAGYIPLGIVWFVGGVLTGLHFPYFAVVLASGLLLAAWSGDRRLYPVDVSPADVP
jgi:hypothetical protein